MPAKNKPIIKVSWSPASTGTLHQINPTHAEIDQYYRDFRNVDLANALEYGDLKKVGKTYSLNVPAESCGWFFPSTFTLADIADSKRIFKEHKEAIIRSMAADWNEMKPLKDMLRRHGVVNAGTVAHMIFAVWQHNNEPCIPDDRIERKKKNGYY